MLHIEQWAFDTESGQISLQKWQKTVDLMAGLFNATAGFVVQATDDGYQVVIASTDKVTGKQVKNLICMQTNNFCHHVIQSNQRLYVSNASQQQPWKDSPEVLKDGFESYLGLPIHWPNGELFGTLCVMDVKATSYSTTFLELIEQLRGLVEDDLALLHSFTQMRKVAMLDPLTHIYNRRALNLLAQQKLNLAIRLGFEVCCLFIDLNDFKWLNDNYGHEAGDTALVTLANTLKQELRDADIVGRFGGDEFVAILQLSDKDGVNCIIEKIQQAFQTALTAVNVAPLTLSIGYSFSGTEKQSFETLLSLADQHMYKVKQAYKANKSKAL